MNISQLLIAICGFSRIYIYIRDGFNKIFFMQFHHSGMCFRFLKCGTIVFRKPDNCCLCLISRTTISLVIFAKESDSLVNYSVIV